MNMGALRAFEHAEVETRAMEEQSPDGRFDPTVLIVPQHISKTASVLPPALGPFLWASHKMACTGTGGVPAQGT